VDAELSLNPQLHGVHIQPEAAPIRRPWHLDADLGRFGRPGPAVGNAKAARRGRHGRDEVLACRYRCALPAGPGAQPALPGPGAKIRVVVGIRERHDLSLGTHLPMAVVPVKHDRRPRIFPQFQALARFVIGIEQDKAGFGGDFFTEDDTRRRLAAAIRRGQDHGVGIRLRGIYPGLCEPLRCQVQGIRR